MIANAERKYEVESNITGDVSRMGIDAAATAHIMGILTDLYSDPEAAIIREYSCNAYDAHVEAGQTKPIEVTTPSSLSPFLTIRDHGIGLTVEDIHAIYSQYGASTKRGTNSQVGCLGLGCKSALTYAAQFTLTSIKDGTLVSVSVSRDEDGGGSMTIVDTRTTDDPDGTEVTIPVKREHQFERKAASFFRYWPEGAVLVNGQPPDRVDGLWVGDNIVVDRFAKNQSYVVMGNVAYPAPFAGMNYPVAFVAFVPIGAVDFVPSREALHMTKRTEAVLADLAKQYQEGVGPAVAERVSGAETHADALAAAVEFDRLVPGVQQYQYKGAALPRHLDAQNGERFYTTDADAYRRGAYHAVRSVAYSAWPTTVWVENFSPGNHTAHHKDKLNAWVARQEFDVPVRTFVLARGSIPRTPFIDDARIVDWSEPKAIKFPRSTSAFTGGKAIKGSYAAYVDGAVVHELAAADIDTANPVLWTQGNLYSSGHIARVLDTHLREYTLVCLPGGRIDKFCRDFPAAERAGDTITRLHTAWTKGLTDDQLAAMNISRSGQGLGLVALDPTRIDDPVLTRAIRLAKMDVGSLIQQENEFGRGVNRTNWQNPIQKYPLAQGYRNNTKAEEHVYIYIKAAYAAEQETV